MNETEHIACQQKKDEELLKIPRPFFLTKTASVSTKAILFCRYVGFTDSIYLPCGKFDIFSLCSNSI